MVSSSSVREMRGDRRGLCLSCDLCCISCWHFELHLCECGVKANLCGFWLWMDDMHSTRSTHNSQDAAFSAASETASSPASASSALPAVVNQ